jgi:hypothetical protein
MKIEDLPRPWLLAAMTGVPVAVLLEQAHREQAERAERAWQKLLGEQCRLRSASKQRAIRTRVRLVEWRSLAS